MDFLLYSACFLFLSDAKILSTPQAPRIFGVLAGKIKTVLGVAWVLRYQALIFLLEHCLFGIS